MKQMMAHIKEERERKLQKQKELEEEEMRKQEEVSLLYMGTVRYTKHPICIALSITFSF